MTNTPESWDDVGRLRLQVDCISVELARMHVREQEHQQERQYMKICHVVSAVTVVFLVCVVALQTIMIYSMYNGSAPALVQRLSDEAWHAHLRDLKDTLIPATQMSADKRRNISALQHTPMKEVVAILNASAVKTDIEATAQTAKEDPQSRIAQSAKEDIQGSNVGEDLQIRHPLSEQHLDDKRLSLPIDADGAVAKARAAEDEAKLAAKNTPKAEIKLLDASQVTKKPKRRKISQKKGQDPVQVPDFPPQLPNFDLSPSAWLELRIGNLTEASPLARRMVAQAQKLGVASEDLNFMLKQIIATRGVPKNATDFETVCEEAIASLPTVASILKERQKRWREM